MGAIKMKNFDVIAVYENGQTLTIKHSSEQSAIETIKVIAHNAKLENEAVTISKGWQK